MYFKTQIFSILFLLIFFYACDDKYATFEKSVITVHNNRSGSADTVMKDQGTDFFYSRLRKKNTGGLSAICFIGPAHQNKKMWVVVSGRVRTNYAHSNSTITLSATSKENEVLLWRAIFLKYYYTDCNKWCYFKDSINLPAGYFNKAYTAITAFAYLGDSEKENFDLDTLKVEFKEQI